MQRFIQGHTHLLGLLRHKNHSSAHPKTITEQSEREERAGRQTALVMLDFTLQSQRASKACCRCEIYRQNTENSAFSTFRSRVQHVKSANAEERDCEDTCSGLGLTSWEADHRHPARRAPFGVPPSHLTFSPSPPPPSSPLHFACPTPPPCYKSWWQQG